MAVLLFVPLLACAPQGPQPPNFGQVPGFGSLPPPQQPGGFTIGAPPPRPAERARVALLLPLSGGNAPLGQSMLDAAQLALFAQQDPRIEFLPRDTRGSPSGAAAAAREAIAGGARVIAGPLTLQETASVAPVARGARVPLLAFTSDETQAGNGVWVLGVTPTQGVRRVVAAAAEAGARRFALIGTEDEFGRRAANALRQAAQEIGGPPPAIALIPQRTEDAASVAQGIAAAGPDAIVIAAAPATARQVAAALASAGSRARLLGTQLWFGNPEATGAMELGGAWFPGPDPEGRARFDGAYNQAYGDRAPRLAGVAYDAAALAARTVRNGQPPVGEAFMGADGPIRMNPDGRLQRGLAVFEIRPGREPVLVQPAPVPGTAGS